MNEASKGSESPDGNRKPKGRWDRALKIARILAIAWLVKLALTVVLYAWVRISDVEKNELDETARAAVRRNVGGAFSHGRDGVTYYEVAGPESAPLVVLAAGSSVPGYIWEPTFDSLKKAGYHVMRYDYFGRGWSDRPDIPLTQDVYVQQLADLLDSLHITKPITLAGLSYGGTVITSFAAEHPLRVGALVYADPAITTPRPFPWYMRWDALGDLLMQIQSRGWAKGQLGDFLHPENFPDWPQRYEMQMRYKGFRRGRLLANEANSELDMRPVLDEVGKNPRPVLVLWGRQDPTVPFARSEALMKALPHAHLVAVDSAGHLPHWEQPAVTHAALFAFLRENAARVK
jgi:pimeloyl-ACP methyl ester carboxylesterase